MRPRTLFSRSLTRWGLIGIVGSFAACFGGAALSATHVVPATTAAVDCSNYGGGIRAGDIVVLGGTSRGPITFRNCVGTASNPITIRNDTTEKGPLVIKQSGDGFKSRCNDCVHVVIDGTGKWAGAPAGTCGVDVTGGDWRLGTTQCGIVFKCESGAPQSGLRFGRSSRHITVKGVEIDGNFPTCTWGIGIDVNDHNYLLADHPGEWREGYVLQNNYIHDTGRSGVYFGPNQGDSSGADLPVRNNEIAYNYVDRTGCDGLKYKSALEGVSSIHHNFVSNTGQSSDGSASGCTSNGIILYEGGFTDVHSNYVESPSPKSGGEGDCILQFTHYLSPTKVASVPARFFNNTVHNCKGNGIVVSAKDSTVAVPAPIIFNNTVIAPIGRAGIAVGSAVATCTVRDNLVAGESISASKCVATNNRVGTVESQNFKDFLRKDFRLTSSSPAVDSGGTKCPSWDQLGSSRPHGAACDQGALEYTGADRTAQPKPPESVVVD